MLQIFIITIVLIALCFLALGIRVWIKGKFADTEVGHNPNMRKLGLCCAKEEEIRLWKENGGDTTSSTSCGCCATCGSSATCGSNLSS